jgi:hypothetical protein
MAPVIWYIILVIVLNPLLSRLKTHFFCMSLAEPQASLGPAVDGACSYSLTSIPVLISADLAMNQQTLKSRSLSCDTNVSEDHAAFTFTRSDLTLHHSENLEVSNQETSLHFSQEKGKLIILHNLYSSPNVVGGACSTRRRDEKYTQNFSWKT